MAPLLSSSPQALCHTAFAKDLHLNDSYNQPLTRGSIPDSVQVIQFGKGFDKTLKREHLPASLTALSFGSPYNRPGLSAVLPTSLRRLQLGGGYDQPMQTGCLPPQLQQLSLCRYKRPLVVFSSQHFVSACENS